MNDIELIDKLNRALTLAYEHLEYCGYGDSWERECAIQGKLAQQVEDALSVYEQWKKEHDENAMGKRKTLKEWANILGRTVAIDKDRQGCFSMNGYGQLIEDDDIWLTYRKSYIPSELIDYEGDWKGSITYPDGKGEVK